MTDEYEQLKTEKAAMEQELIKTWIDMRDKAIELGAKAENKLIEAGVIQAQERRIITRHMMRNVPMYRSRPGNTAKTSRKKRS